MSVDLTKPVRLRNGMEAGVDHTDGPAGTCWEWIGWYRAPSGRLCATWYKDGNAPASDYDLVNVPETATSVRYYNLYEDGFGRSRPSAKEALRYANGDPKLHGIIEITRTHEVLNGEVVPGSLKVEVRVLTPEEVERG